MTTTKTIASRYEAHADYVPHEGDHVLTTGVINSRVAIPGIVIAANDHAAPVIAYPHLGQIQACSARAVTLVRRGSIADATAALAAIVARGLSPIAQAV